MKIGDKVYWKKNPLDVYTIEKFGFRHDLDEVYVTITNVHGHEVRVRPTEIYPAKVLK